MDKRAELAMQARELTLSPGVYLMKDASGTVIYVGKAKALRNRVSTYFQPATHEVLRTEHMVRSVEFFETIVTQTETEALILECTLIKRYRPRFNIRLKDDKAYPYLKIQVSAPYPRVEWTRKVQRDGARYFGPFPSASSARQVLHLLNERFKLRDCNENVFHHRSRPCLLYQMDKCTGPCVKLISEQDYRSDIDQIIAILDGRDPMLIDELEAQMREAAERESFEEAAQIRDRMFSLKTVTRLQSVLEAGSVRDRDVVGLAREGTFVQGVFLQIRGGQLISIRPYALQNSDPSQSRAEVLGELLEQHYFAEESKPLEVVLPEALVEPEWIGQAFGVVPKLRETEIDDQLLRVAQTNAEEALKSQKSRSEFGHGLKVLEEIQDKLGLARPPERIECYDISNILGQDAVASRVVFVQGAPDKNLYRRYKIKTVEGANDFAMMREVLGRRFSPQNAAEALPDLVVVDGGKGQLSQAVTIMEELNVQGVAVVGLAKARTESDYRATEVESSQERIFIPGRKNPIPLLPHTGAFKLLTHVRDEAHRFAIGYHRLLRDKRSMGSNK